MDLPLSKLSEEYAGEIKVIESNIKDIASGEAPQELYEYTQSKLDKLATRFQYNERLGSARYKLYELQALLYYFQNRDDDALAFIQQAVETKGAQYKRAEQLIGKIQSAPATHSQSSKHNFDKPSSHKLPLKLQSLIKGARASAIIMAVLSIISVYFIPWGVFYIILATKLKPEKLPNRKLIKWAAIVTLPLCTAIIPIFIDIEFWRMNKRLKEYEEQGSDAFISDKEFLAGEPKRRKRRVVSWVILLSIIALFTGLLIAAAISGNSNSSSSNTAGINSSDNEVDGAYERMEALRSEYDTCSSALETRRDLVNTSSDYAVNSYNNDMDDCENTRLKLNRAVDEYNRLAGFE